MLDGFSSKEITRKLNICNSTVDYHRTKLYGKLGVHSIHELFAKYATNGKFPPLKLKTVLSVSGIKNKSAKQFAKQSVYSAPAGSIIPAYNLGFFASTEKEIGGNSTAEIYVTREEIDGTLIDSVLNIKIKMAKKGDNSEYAQAFTYKNDVIKRLRKTNGIRFKAKGDGKPWYLEIKTIESKQEAYWISYMYEFGTVKDQVIFIDVPYSSLYLPEWAEQKYYFDFNKEKINGLDICTKPFKPENANLFLQIFDFETY